MPEKLPALPPFTPVPRKKDRSNGWKPEVQRAFIEALADTGSVTSACRAVNRSTHGAYYLRRQPGAEEFAAAWQAALDLGMQRIEDVAMDRALNGVEQPVYSYGKLVGTRMVHNDRLLMFMLRNRAPERFAEGRAKGLNAVGKMEMQRLKKQWREEWEAEQAAKHVSQADVRASIDRKVEALRRQVHARQRAQWIALAPETRAAFRHYHTILTADPAASGDTALPDWAVDEEAVEAEIARQAQRMTDDDEPGDHLPPEGWNRGPEGKPDESGPKSRRLKDDGWE